MTRSGDSPEAASGDLHEDVFQCGLLRVDGGDRVGAQSGLELEIVTEATRLNRALDFAPAS